MIEIVCPNCQAHYQLPDGAIGPEGRKVSCANCSHKWRAHLDDSSTEEAPREPELEEMDEAEESVEDVLASASSATQELPESLNVNPPPASGGRDEQMAAIRKMLSDLKESAKDVPDSAESNEKDDVADANAPSSANRRWSEDEDGRDTLRDRIDDVDKLSRMVKGEPTSSGYDAAKLRKRHEKRAKRLQKARERRKRSGAFLSGFTFVVVVAGTFTGLYVFHPQISAADPRMEPALTQYVTTIDRYRVELKDTSEEWKEWLFERFGMLKDQAEKRGFVKAGDAQSQ